MIENYVVVESEQGDRRRVIMESCVMMELLGHVFTSSLTQY